MFPMSRIALALHEAGHEVHVVSVDNERGRNGIVKMFDGTGVDLHLTPGMEMDIIMTDMGKDRIDPKDKFVGAWMDGAVTKVKELKPDIIVADLMGKPGLIAANELNLPVIINNPAGPFSMYQSVGIEKVPNMANAKNRCGRLVIE